MLVTYITFVLSNTFSPHQPAICYEIYEASSETPFSGCQLTEWGEVGGVSGHVFSTEELPSHLQGQQDLAYKLIEIRHLGAAVEFLPFGAPKFSYFLSGVGSGIQEHKNWDRLAFSKKAVKIHQHLIQKDGKTHAFQSVKMFQSKLIPRFLKKI